MLSIKWILKIERELHAQIERCRGESSHTVEERLVERIVDKELPLNGELSEKERARNEEQRKAVIQLTTRPGSIQVMQGMAGTGNAYTLNVARQIWQKAVSSVLGMALSAAAAKNLSERAGIEIETRPRSGSY